MGLSRLFGGDAGSRQYAALPFLRGASGDLLVCLITSRGTGRWVLPKGWPKADFAPHDAAAAEAREEAGLIGTIAREPAGSYGYRKRLHLLASVACRVEVFPFQVEAQLRDWPEKAQRDCAWFDIAAAASRVHEPELADLIVAFGARYEQQEGLS